jgi:hypothetical protein
MPEYEVIKSLLEVSQVGLFLWLYLRSEARREEQDKRHEADVKQLYEMRVSELKVVARLPTNLEGVPPARVPA